MPLLPPRRESPEHVRRTDDVAGCGEALGDGPDVGADPEDLLDEHEARPRPRFRDPHVHVHAADVARHGNGLRRSHRGILAHRPKRAAPVVACAGVRLDEFDYELPADRIAQVPIEPRDAARLLVDRGSAAPEHRTVRELPELLRAGDLLVVNETRVIPARLRLTRRTGGGAEVLLLEPTDGARRTWEALVRPARKLRTGEVLLAASGEEIVRVGERTPAGDTFAVELLGPLDALELLDRHGEMPLPPYITHRLAEQDRYQTVYANEPGSAAAPTAGLHFTPELLAQLAARRHRTRHGRTGGRARHVPAGHRAGSSRPPDALRALPGTRRHLRALPRGRTRSSPSGPPRCGRSSRRPRPAG